jgi:hypothetical protein
MPFLTIFGTGRNLDPLWLNYFLDSQRRSSSFIFSLFIVLQNSGKLALLTSPYSILYSLIPRSPPPWIGPGLDYWPSWVDAF